MMHHDCFDTATRTVKPSHCGDQACQVLACDVSRDAIAGRCDGQPVVRAFRCGHASAPPITVRAEVVARGKETAAQPIKNANGCSVVRIDGSWRSNQPTPARAQTPAPSEPQWTESRARRTTRTVCPATDWRIRRSRRHQ
jgi:hypothetical protein